VNLPTNSTGRGFQPRFPVPHLDYCSILDSRQQNRATSLDNLPRINQRREVETHNVHLSLESIGVLNHGANDSILDLAMVQVHADFVAYLKFALWVLSWHARKCTIVGIRAEE